MSQDRAATATPEPELYRQIIDWDKRLEHEGPFLLEALGVTPGARVLDLGSAAGEHDRWLAAQGAQVVGVDRSAEMIAAARTAAAGDARIEYREGDLVALPAELAGPFDAAMCVGNTLVHILDEAGMAAFAQGVAERLRPGGAFLIQILNYEAIVAEKRRAMPPRFVRGAEGELVFLRFMDHREPGYVDFESVVLRRRDDAPVELVSSRTTRLRAWTRHELVPIIEREVGPVAILGGMAREPFDPARSSDLVLLARRRG